MKLIAINESNIIWFVTANEGSVINVPSTKKNQAIKNIGNSGNKIDNISVIDKNSIGSIKVKLTKSKILVYPKNFRTDFFIFKARLTFIKLK